jgi:hypothetical protein
MGEVARRAGGGGDDAHPTPDAFGVSALPIKGREGGQMAYSAAAGLGAPPITAFTSRYSAKPKSPHSRPLPLIL